MLIQVGIYNSHHSDCVVCPKCGARGKMDWDEVVTPRGYQKEFASISGDFYERLCKKAPFPIELVCNGCGTACPGAVQP